MSATELVVNEETPENNVILNGYYGVKLRDNDVKDISGSQDMFSDDDQIKSTVYLSPKVTVTNETFNTSIISLKTPVLCASKLEETPGKPVIPRTPADLLPFITKTSLLWTSDMETPETKLKEMSVSRDKMDNSADTNCTPPNQRPSTPTCVEIKQENLDILTSPVLGRKKKSKRCAKRRILNNVISDSESIQNSICSNSDKGISDTNSVTSEIVIQELQNTELIPKEFHELAECTSQNKENKEKLIEEPSAFDKNSNTSTQEFFYNASFSSIDQLCSSIIPEKKPKLTTNSDTSSSKSDNCIKEETSELTEDKQVEIDSNVLERVAAIKRSQKPLRRLSDINHTVIPKETFSCSARELELANVKFSYEKKDRKSQPLKPTSFMNLSSLDNNLDSDVKPIIKKEINLNAHDVPVEIMDEWDVVDPKVQNQSNVMDVLNVTKNVNTINDNYSNVHIKQECDVELEENNVQSFIQNLENIPINSDLVIHDSTIKTEPIKNELPNLNCDLSENDVGGFSTASGKGIAISENKLSNYLKVYNEIENENLNENIFLGLKKKKFSKLQLKKSSTISTISVQKTNEKPLPLRKENVIDKKEKLKLFQELDLQEFLELKCSSESAESDGFGTASGKNIAICKEKENHCLDPYDKLGDVDENGSDAAKQSEKLPFKMNQKPENKALMVFKNCTFNQCLINTNVQVGEKQICIESKSVESNANITNDSFSTAKGKKIEISDEKKNYYSKIYETLNADEKDLLSLKQNKVMQLTRNNKSTSKLIVPKNLIKTTVQELKPTTSNVENTSDGFSTASGKNISVSEEKNDYYSKIYSKLSQEVPNENAFLNLNKTRQLKQNISNKLLNKTSVPKDNKNNEEAISKAKLSFSSDTDEVFYNLGEVEKLFVSPLQADSIQTELSSKDHFVIPSSSNNTKKTTSTSSVTKPITVNQEKIDDISEPVTSSTPLRNLPQSRIASQIQIGLLKRKLENCEPKRPERCRSFGGFAQEGTSPRACKLNKSDPIDESHVNQPLGKGLSVSQCFDPHSDSWLSKIEISYLNSSRPDVQPEKRERSTEEQCTAASDWKTDKTDDFLGFSDKECVESFQIYANFEKFVRKESVNLNRCTKLTIPPGQSISIVNKTPITQHLCINFGCRVEVKISADASTYYLVECAPVEIVKTSPVNDESKLLDVEADLNDKVAEKRKHADTDSDTPLTTFKKPRVGYEFQGRKLFSDESDVEENPCNLEDRMQDHQIVVENANVDVIVEEENFAEEMLEAVMQQEKIIRNKKRMKIKPIVGSLLKQRLENSKNRKSWYELVGDAMPTARSIEQIKEYHADTKILEVTASNAASYKFLTSNIVGNKKVPFLDLEDNAKLIFDENGHAGVTEFTDAFLAMPGVDPKLLPIGWIENHYRWIIWKLATTDLKSFDTVQLPKFLTVERVMKELKYRYDREIDRSERPALRKILEKDDAASRRMVLCISSIEEIISGNDADKEARIKLGLPRWRIEATDGWYNIPLSVDNIIENNISNGKIKEGTKIITYGAELLDCERGVHPLEKPSNISLKIFSNCTRRVKWDTKLGYQKTSRPIPVKLKSIIPSGGLVGETTVVAVRVYPLLYREKTANGQSIYRNSRSEEKAAIAHERACELKVNAMYAEAEKNFDSRKKSDSDEDIELSQITSKSQMKTRNQCHVERKQEEFKQKLESQVRNGLPPPRQVTPVLKVRLLDDCTTAMLSIWGANEDSTYDIKEGNTITMYNVFANSARAGELTLTANRMTHIKTETLLKLPFPCRVCTLIPDITTSLFEPKFNEFDTIGVVVSSGPAPYGMKNFEVVSLAYPRPLDAGSAYLCVLFWNGISSFGYQALFTPGAIVACSNLEWRRGNSWSLPVAYCSEKSLFTSNPRQSHLATQIRNLKSLIQNPVTYAESCVEEVQAELAKKPKPRSCQGTPTERLSFQGNASIISPQESSTNMSIQKRLEKLSQYGGLADVSPIVLNNSSARVKKDYTPVTLRNNT